MYASHKVEIKTPEEIEVMAEGGTMLRYIRERIVEAVRPGVTTRELDRLARRLMDARGVLPAFLGYQGFPATLCTSINEEIVHGIPGDRRLVEGDILSLDFGLVHRGFYVDTAATVPVGSVDPETQRLLETTRRALAIAIEHLRPGERVGDLGAAVQAYVESQGFSVVREYAGHGIGRRLHEEPRIPNHGRAGRGPRWQPGMVVAIEPMVNMGGHPTRLLADQWTVVTADGRRSAHEEHTVAITGDGPRVLT